MNIRNYQKIDEDAVITLWDKCNLIVASNNPIQDIKRKMSVDPSLFLIAEVKGNIVSTVMGGYEGHRGWINYLAVDPEYRRNGLGRKIMFKIEHILKERGCPKINLQIRASNKDVITFYKKIGFLNDDVLGLGKRLVEDEKFNS